MKHVHVVQSVLVLVLLASVTTGGVVAQSDSGDADLYASLEEMVPAYNENADSVDLGPISLAGANNLYIQDGASVITYSILMDQQNRITGLDDGPDADAKRKITADRATVEAITSADNPASAFRDAVANDDIVIAGEDGQPIEKIKWAVLNLFKGVFL